MEEAMMVKTKQAEVPEMFEYLDKTIAEAEAVLDVLASRLVVVMREDMPQETDAKPEKGYSCEIARMLADKNSKIIKICRRIQSLEKRLEI